MTTINIEDFEVGPRYINVVSPRFDNDWRVASVTRRIADVQPLRDGRFVDMEIVTVTYNNGISMTHETGTPIAVDVVA